MDTCFQALCSIATCFGNYVRCFEWQVDFQIFTKESLRLNVNCVVIVPSPYWLVRICGFGLVFPAIAFLHPPALVLKQCEKKQQSSPTSMEMVQEWCLETKLLLKPLLIAVYLVNDVSLYFVGDVVIRPTIAESVRNYPQRKYILPVLPLSSAKQAKQGHGAYQNFCNALLHAKECLQQTSCFLPELLHRVVFYFLPGISYLWLVLVAYGKLARSFILTVEFLFGLLAYRKPYGERLVCFSAALSSLWKFDLVFFAYGSTTVSKNDKL